VWNRTTSVSHEVAEHIDNVNAVENVTDIPKSADIIWSCLANENAVEDVYTQILQGDVAGKLFVECSSIPGPATNALSDRVKAAGADFLALPGTNLFHSLLSRALAKINCDD
jgi:3-hydroxyisobutyrate dehydrogenase-like beta-hydroxyacid dehydrogenase